MGGNIFASKIGSRPSLATSKYKDLNPHLLFDIGY